MSASATQGGPNKVLPSHLKRVATLPYDLPLIVRALWLISPVFRPQYFTQDSIDVRWDL